MITKVAVAAWKQMMPYLSEETQRKLIQFRKPLAEYNASMSRANEAIADKLGFNITARNNSGVNPFGERAAENILNKSDLPKYHPISGSALIDASVERDAEIAKALLKNPSLSSSAKRIVQRELDKLPVNQPYYKKITVADSFGNAKGDYTRNLVMRHELDEGKNMSKYYEASPDASYIYFPRSVYTPKKGVQLLAPETSIEEIGKPNVMGHASLDVLKDEFKNALKSGYTDMYFMPNKHLGLGTDRLKSTKEIPDIVKTRAQASKKRDHLNNVFDPDKEELKAGKEYFTRGDVKKMQSQFFTDMRRQQSRNNIRSSEPVAGGMAVPTWNLYEPNLKKR